MVLEKSLEDDDAWSSVEDGGELAAARIDVCEMLLAVRVVYSDNGMNRILRHISGKFRRRKRWYRQVSRKRKRETMST